MPLHDGWPAKSGHETESLDPNLDFLTADIAEVHAILQAFDAKREPESDIYPKASPMAKWLRLLSQLYP